ncbi:MAG TPA: TetR/AcrR family transcriptional regulator [Solirubrobacterales bacterium]|jgi:AcrR family transcriptional regulator|nr:TetR/AcrR family transcriptional regulator [Solirubrobacterales bacterium]
MSPQSPRPSAGGNSDPPPLPRGRHRLPFEFVVDNQRRRLLTGAARALATHGYADFTVKHVIEAAGVSRATFYANFDNKRDCVLAAHRDVFERLVALIFRACAAERQWPLKVRAAITDSFALMVAEPGAGRLLTLNAVATDMEVARQVIDSNAHLAALLRDGRRQTPLGPTLPDLIEEGLIGALSAIVTGRLLDRGVEGLAELPPELVQLVLTPYVGVEEAARVATGAE